MPTSAALHIDGALRTASCTHPFKSTRSRPLIPVPGFIYRVFPATLHPSAVIRTRLFRESSTPLGTRASFLDEFLSIVGLIRCPSPAGQPAARRDLVQPYQAPHHFLHNGSPHIYIYIYAVTAAIGTDNYQQHRRASRRQR